MTGKVSSAITGGFGWNTQKQAMLEVFMRNYSHELHGFIKYHYRDFNWLLRHDRKWLDLKLPVIKKLKQISIFD